MTKITLPYLHTVWATGSFNSDHGNHPITTVALQTDRKRTKLPLPFYAQRCAEFEISEIDDYVQFDIFIQRSPRKNARYTLCLDSEGNLYKQKWKIEEISNPNSFNLWTSDNRLVWEQTGVNLHVTEDIPNRRPGNDGRYIFFGSISDLSNNAVIVGESCEENQKFAIQEILDRFTIINGFVWEKTPEPFLCEFVGETSHLVFEDDIASVVRVQCHKKSHSIFQHTEINNVFIENVTGSESLLNREDNRDFNKALEECIGHYRLPVRDKFYEVLSEQTRKGYGML